MREMVLVLANLFGRRYLHGDFINRMKPKSSIVSKSCLHMREKEHRLIPSGEHGSGVDPGEAPGPGLLP